MPRLLVCCSTSAPMITRLSEVGARAGGESRRVEAVVIVERAGEPPAARHAHRARQQQCRDAPERFRRRKQLARRQHVGRNDAAEPQPECSGNREQPDLVLREQERNHGRALARRADQHGGEAAEAIRDIAPDLAADERAGEQCRQHGGAQRHADAEIVAERDQVPLRHRHRYAAQRNRHAHQPEHDIGRPAEYARLRIRRSGGRRRQRHLGRRAQIDDGERHHDGDLEYRVEQHRLAPAHARYRCREDERPHRAGEIASARDQRQRRAAAAIEPAADIDVHRCVDAAEAQQADEQAVPDQQRPCRPKRGDRKADRDHR